MSFIARAVLVPLAISLALAARQQPTFELVWRPKADDLLAYKMRADIDSTPERFSFTVNVKNHVLKIKPNGDYDVETVIKNGHVLHGTHDDPIPDDDKPTVDTYNARGEKIASSEEKDPSGDANPGFDALDAVTDHLSPKDPVSIGGTWSTIIKANAKLKQEAAKVTYTLVSKVKENAFQTLRIEFKYRETDLEPPTTAEGYILVNQDDFSLVRFEALLKGPRFIDDPDFPKGDVTISVIRD